MSLVTRPLFARGWMPDADPVGCPSDALLRMDNCVLDELGLVSLRRGAGLLSTLGTADAHSLYTAVLNGTRYRFAVGGATVYGNGSSLASSVAGSDDVTFGSMLGQVFFARSTTKKKYDGTAVRNWGISQTGGTPTVAAGGASSLVFASGDSSESPAFTIEADNGTGATFVNDHSAVSNGALKIIPSTTLAQAIKVYSSDVDYTDFGGGVSGTDDDLFSIWVYLANPSTWQLTSIFIDVNSTTRESDFYVATFYNPVSLGTIGGAKNVPVSPLLGWNLFTIRRGDFARDNPTTAHGWNTVKAFRFANVTTTGGAANYVALDDARFSGGTAKVISGTGLQWKYVLVYNAGTYATISAPSAASAAASFGPTAITVTAPADATRDTQVNEIWLYRLIAGDYYRVTVKTSVSGTGSVGISDALSDTDALEANIKLIDDAGVPPDTIIGIAGPHYDRLWALTATTLYPSRQLRPETFASGEAITIGGADEIAYWIVKAPGGLYVGTSKDIYRLNGTGNPLPDGSIDIQKEPLGIDHPPISAAVAAEGANVIYLANDGWRGIDGYSSTSLVGVTSLLYKGQTRHGVGPVNLASGRFRCVLGRGQFIAITPESSSTTSSTALYRYVVASQQWYRHIYAASWRSIAREPDGTVILGDTAGKVWTLDTETDGDNGSGMEVTVWTKVDDLGDPFRQKDPTDVHVQLASDGDNITADIHVDSSDTAALSSTLSAEDLTANVLSLLDVATSRHLQLRLSGTVTTFRLGAIGWNTVPLPLGVLAFDSGPITVAGREVIWLRAVRVHVMGSSDLTITPYIDGQAQAAVTVTPLSVTQAVPVIAWFGTGYKGGVVRFKVESASAFVLYWLEIIHRVSGSLEVDKRIIQVRAA